MTKNRSKTKLIILRLLLDIAVFRLVVYLLNMIHLNILFLSKFYIYRFSYKFDTVLYQFPETVTSD